MISNFHLYTLFAFAVVVRRVAFVLATVPVLATTIWPLARCRFPFVISALLAYAKSQLQLAHSALTVVIVALSS